MLKTGQPLLPRIKRGMASTGLDDEDPSWNQETIFKWWAVLDSNQRLSA
jgi:hypothetical protein